MLAAERAQLDAHGHNQKAVILEKELNWLFNDLTTIATQASLLAGLSVAAINTQQSSNTNLAQSDQYKDEPEWQLVMETMYMISAGGSVCSSLLVMCQAVFLLTWGPNKALRGNMDDFEEAVYALREERMFVLRLFFVACLCVVTLGSVACVTWWDYRAALVCLPLWLACVTVMLLRYRRVRARFQGPSLFLFSCGGKEGLRTQAHPRAARMQSDPAEQVRDTPTAL
jgi:hypothetical protein